MGARLHGFHVQRKISDGVKMAKIVDYDGNTWTKVNDNLWMNDGYVEVSVQILPSKQGYILYLNEEGNLKTWIFTTKENALKMAMLIMKRYSN